MSIWRFVRDGFFSAVVLFYFCFRSWSYQHDGCRARGVSMPGGVEAAACIAASSEGSPWRWCHRLPGRAEVIPLILSRPSMGLSFVVLIWCAAAGESRQDAKAKVAAPAAARPSLPWCRVLLRPWPYTGRGKKDTMDVNMRRAEDVLAHKRLLELAKDSVQHQAFAVGVVQVSCLSLLATLAII